MATSSGVAPHTAFLNAGGTWPIERGMVTQYGVTSKPSNFTVAIPMSFPGAFEALSGLSESNASVMASNVAGSGTLITGEVDKIEFDFIGRTIIVMGVDTSRTQHNTKSSQKWVNKTGPDIVKQLVPGAQTNIASGGLMAGKKLEKDFVRLSDNTSVAYVIHKLAEFDGARTFTDRHGQFHYESTQGGGGGGFTVHYKAPTAQSPMVCDAKQLRVVANVQLSKNINVTVNSFHSKLGRVFTGKSGFGGRGGSLMYKYNPPNLSKDHAQQYAKSKAAQHARNRVIVEVDCVGDPNVDVTTGLTLSGTGAFDGSYEIDRIIHQFGMIGYTMNIVAKSPDGGSGGGAHSGTWAPTDSPGSGGGGGGLPGGSPL